ncbi:MAG: hypothetical protein BECKG1743D_GA0114223_105853 [Candidatus Kentron sp. G]|nr:MAG: hypothetical protein BECKG1743F_GA0114225_105812 [Candidatus Kentron sp. G]VFN03264.1 MAG: hypothetical protein BECKG1743E_GA0114224_105952 [Candidatus Kentron sp. G]VFN04421.1 MAG: hypothetical protein BECKG1743D_GA0114223_105853 [Candidatus Kentron sp. G]
MPAKAIEKQEVAAVEYWRGVARELAETPHRQRGAAIERAAQTAGVSKKTAYRHLKAFANWKSERKRRADAGKTRQPDESLMAVAAMLNEDKRENGKEMLTIQIAMSIAERSGYTVNVGQSQIAKLLKRRQLDRESLAHAQTYTRMRSRHPNHVHLADPSLCVVYYAGGRLRLMREKQFYKNKLEQFKKIQFRVWRYVLTDHYSGTITVKYYEAAGETQ